jgi:hypothetical protein
LLFLYLHIIKMKRFFLVILFISLVCSEVGSQTPGLNQKTQSEKGFFSRIFGKGKNSPGTAGKSKKQQEATKRKQKKEWNKYVKKSQQHTFDIQSPEVKDRMKQNKKDIASRDKAKKKQIRKSTKKAGQKYN